ncbi:MAG: DUF3883 domain-containing protein [Methylotenera sp.]|nr:DUF3883 domain-containing protein [Methylotenera sp.]
MSDNKHKNYEALNLIGYGLAKFNNDFVIEFGAKSKSEFYEIFVLNGIADTASTVKNRQDLFDPFFDNGRKGWWQKGDAYIHRKVFIDSLFGNLNAADYASVVKLYLLKENHLTDFDVQRISPIIKSKFKQLKTTGEEAEIYFMNNYKKIPDFSDAGIEDARNYGDGYDFQIQKFDSFLLAEIKGVRAKKGAFRLTENEYFKAKEYKSDYGIVVVSNLDDLPKMTVIFDPVHKLELTERSIETKQLNFHSQALEW